MDMKQIRQQLLEQKAELESRLQRTHKHIYEKDQPVSANFNEQIKETENDQLVMSLEAEANEELNQIRKALQRIDEGDYPDCARCGEAIGEQRLAAVPYTDRCIKCAEL
jgi:RNA polymerase-binding protein DksA